MRGSPWVSPFRIGAPPVDKISTRRLMEATPCEAHFELEMAFARVVRDVFGSERLEQGLVVAFRGRNGTIKGCSARLEQKKRFAWVAKRFRRPKRYSHRLRSPVSGRLRPFRLCRAGAEG